MINSIRKGKNFEREVAKILTKITGVKWMRVPQSGATATTQGTENFRGDIFCEDEKYKNVVVECKIRKEPILLEELFEEEKKQNKLADWITQTKKEAQNKKFILFCKSNNRKIIVVSNDKELIHMFSSNFFYFKNNYFTLLTFL